MLPGAGTVAQSAAVAQKILRLLQEPFILEGQRIEVGASVGMAFYPEHGKEVQALLRQADVAMYVAKRERTGYCVYAPGKDESASRQLTLTADLRQALELNQLELHYQPKVDMRRVHHRH